MHGVTLDGNPAENDRSTVICSPFQRVTFRLSPTTASRLSRIQMVHNLANVDNSAFNRKVDAIYRR